MRFVKAALGVGIITLVTRLIGCWRDVLQAQYIGTGLVMDALSAAIKIPTFFRRIFADGALNGSFIPIFNDLNSDSKQKAIDFMNQVISWMCFILLILIVAFEIIMPSFISLFLVGSNKQLVEMATLFSRIMFPFVFFIPIAAIFSGVLNANRRFGFAASATAVGNLVLVSLFFIVDPEKIEGGREFAVTLTLSGIAQFVWVLIPCLAYGIRPKIVSLFKASQSLKLFAKRMVPAALSSGVLQISLIVNVFVASLLPVGANSYLYYADRFYQLPLTIASTAMGTVLLPMLSTLWKQNKTEEALYTQNRAIEFSLLITIPTMAGLILLAEPLVGVLFERGKFSASDTLAVSQTVCGFAFGLPAYVLTKVFVNAFFARQDTKTPIIIATVSIVVHLLLNFVFLYSLNCFGIALATALSSWFNVIFLGFLLALKRMIVFEKKVFVYLAKVILNTALSVLLMGYCYSIFSKSHVDVVSNLSSVLAAMVGGAAYFNLSYLMGCLKFSEYIHGNK